MKIFFTNTHVNKVFALRSLSIPKVGPGILYDQNYVYYLYAIFSIVSEILDVQMKAISWVFSICFEKQIWLKVQFYILGVRFIKYFCFLISVFCHPVYNCFGFNANNILSVLFCKCFWTSKYPIWKRLFAGTVPENNTLFAGTILRLTPLKCP